MNIITFTVNPALDKSAKVDGLVPENKLICHSIDYKPGGGGINVSRILSRLGVSSECIFTSGGDNGKHVEKLLLEESIHVSPIRILQPTRENLSVVDTTTNQQYRFGMPGAIVSQTEMKTLITNVRSKLEDGDILVLSGSVPEGLPSNFYELLINSLDSKKLKVVIDTSGEALKEIIKQPVFMIKPNQKELAYLAGKDFLSNLEQEHFAMSLVNSYPVEYVAVSMGARGAFLASKTGVVYQTTPSVPVKSTVGAGDSMLAGLIYGIKNNLSPKEMLQYGVACGTATTMSEGTSLGSISSIEKTLQLLN